MKEKLLYVGAGFVVCLMLAVTVGRWSLFQPAHAQTPGASAGATTVALGEVTRNVLPVVIVDSVDNALLIYEVDMSRSEWRLELKNARTYRYDKQLREFRTTPSVGAVRERLQ